MNIDTIQRLIDDYTTMNPSPQPITSRLIRLVLTGTLPFAVAIVVGVGSFGLSSWRGAVQGIESHTETLQEVVEAALNEMIIAYLHAKTETAIGMIERIDTDAQLAGEEAAPLARIRDQLISLTIARSGYVYAIDMDGQVVVHPDPETRDRILAETEPVRTQLQQQIGYLEYFWQNSFEPRPLPKALYMRVYAPRQWIVAATAYREEFVSLVDPDRLSELISTVSLGEESYSLVVNRQGELIVHPEFAGQNLKSFFDDQEGERIMRALFGDPSGTLRYSFPDPSTGESTTELLVFQYLAEYDWTIGTTLDIATIRRPIVVSSVFALIIAAALVFVVIRLSLRVARTISEPVTRVTEAAERGLQIPTDLLSAKAPAEIIVLTKRFNDFVIRVDEQNLGLRKNIEEKTMLIREIHHRVRNNLQVVASLLTLQAAEAQDPAAASLFHRNRDRVVSIAIVHEQLYTSKNLSMIPFDLYLHDLMSHVGDANHMDGVNIQLEVQPYLLGIDRAVPCGLIVNELVANAYMHAFAVGSTGIVGVRFDRNEDQYTLEVWDDGVGIDARSRQSLGMTLINSLVEQIGGVIMISGTDGTSARITFPADENLYPPRV